VLKGLSLQSIGVVVVEKVSTVFDNVIQNKESIRFFDEMNFVNGKWICMVVGFQEK
jgi:hypothetical protein